MRTFDDEKLRGDAASWFERNKSDFVETVEKLVRVPSVAEPFDDKHPSAPFGIGCSHAVDMACEIGEALGFQTRNHDYYAASIRWNGSVPQASAAFYSHLDVVAPGGGWTFDPFSPFLKDGYLFGRGTADNKGAAIAVLFAFRYLKEQGWRPKRTWTLYLGACEESTMDDVRYLVEHEPMSQVNLVSDAAFSVCIGEKGNVNATFDIPIDDPVIKTFEAGSAPNAVAGYAHVELDGIGSAESQRQSGVDGNATVRFDIDGISTHAARPKGSRNAIALAADTLARSAALSRKAHETFRVLQSMTSGYDGSAFGIKADGVLGPLTCVATMASFSDGVLSVLMNIRFPETVTDEGVEGALEAFARKHGFGFSVSFRAPAFLRDQDQPIVKLLVDIASNVKHERLDPYTMGGGTYAKWIPGALGFGPCDLSFASPFGPGRGGAHEPDEAVLVDDLRDAFIAYVSAVAAIDSDLSLRTD